MLNKNLKLGSTVLRRYEPNIGLYCFYNAQTKSCINTDYQTGSILCALDGTVSVKDVIGILAENNNEVSASDLQEKLLPVFENLLKEDFLVTVNG